MSKLDIDENVRQKWRKERRKKDMTLIFVSIAILLLVGGFVVAWSFIKCSKNYEEALDKECKYDSFEPVMVDLSDISEIEPKEMPIKDWAEKSKDEKYLEDISESMPEEVVESAKVELSEQELGYLEEDIKAVEELVDQDRRWTNMSLPAYLIDEVYEDCENYGVPTDIFFALMYTESSMREDIGTEKVLGGEEGGPRYYGYMQLSAENCDRAKQYGLDAHTPEGNIEMAAMILSEKYDKYGSWEYALAAYKGGDGYADSHKAKGTIPKNVQKILEKREDYK